ncbi:VOC family protein [Mycobacterium sp. CBMA293]|uniref:VOC family protein n=1 Tax=unclassified Mycolicibacterium TaxID=2636767 RepID=UPI0012DC2BA3|nr:MULTISPECIES: VOC family protein [unclassified Mycolicibacterium]MUL48812.1 VOC family protein [Mycolicibacterium sp. CBMA 360]MUL62268.1 VOC family protein [Mycolicibacterium sp. CBMA 335]MUL71728.1 VOC family protein [Mycolicibacterium sp. CBMA 311]MUL93683.1 VOC family protein [Mycolicibacterium sp. CBMA 230]MUM09369.1 glyoxalase [Mycolicibacterium sp. CBMA 213]
MTAAITAQLAPGHVGLNVTDLTRSVDFYRRALGFEQLLVSSEGDRKFAFLGLDGTLRLTLWEQSDGNFSTATPGLHHLAFLVPDIEQVRAAESALKELSVPFTYDGIVVHAEGMTSGGIFFNDPDGIRLEVYTASGAEAEPSPHGSDPACGFF